MNSQEQVIEGYKISSFQSTTHLSFSKYHISCYSAVLACEGKLLNGMTVIKQVKTRCYGFGKWGKSSVLYFLSYPKNTKTFKSIEDLIMHYHEQQK